MKYIGYMSFSYTFSCICAEPYSTSAR